MELKITKVSFGHFFLSILFNSQVLKVSKPGVRRQAIKSPDSFICNSFAANIESLAPLETCSQCKYPSPFMGNTSKVNQAP